MSHKRTVIIVIAIVVALLLFLRPKPASKDPGTAETAPVSESMPAPTPAPAAQPQGASQPQLQKFGAPAEANLTKEEAALQTLSTALYEYTALKGGPKKLIQELTNAGLKPIATQDFNAETGKMLIVRTNEALPGTRYFHAQFFEDASGGEPFLQHMSFEFRPGRDSMDKALQAVQSKYPGLGKPTQQSQDYAQWSTKDGYIIWVKKMDAEDLKGDPFNAYTNDDVGTVRVAIELDIHEHDDDPH